jgi:hypothetical protein
MGPPVESRPSPNDMNEMSSSKECDCGNTVVASTEPSLRVAALPCELATIESKVPTTGSCIVALPRSAN